MSEDEVSFGPFARLFRDRLNCANAFFLDRENVSNPLFARCCNAMVAVPVDLAFPFSRN
jgi:uncharacterized protein YigE (DUF2233 family)